MDEDYAMRLDKLAKRQGNAGTCWFDEVEAFARTREVHSGGNSPAIGVPGMAIKPTKKGDKSVTFDTPQSLWPA
jgi:hypothetical protein